MDDLLRPPTTPRADAGRSWWQQRWPTAGFDPLDADVATDVVVVGGGVTGCSTAWHLARAGARVTLLEAREIASGASGRNGGFLLAGLAHRIVALGELVGAARAGQLFAATVEGRDRLLETAALVGAGACVERTGSLRLAVDVDELDDLDQEATALEAIGARVERLGRAALPDGLGRSFLGGLRFPDDARSVPAGWVRALGAAAAGAGAALHEHSPVGSITDGPGGVEVRTQDGLVVRAAHVVVATEAWLGGLLPELRGHVLPYRSQVLATAPPRDADTGEVRRLLSHVTWSRRGWDYAQQTADGHLVVGGERLERVELLRTWDETVADDDQRWLEGWVQHVLGVGSPEVVARWAGVLAQTPDGFPWIGELPGRPRVLACGGWGGAGNVLGFVAGGWVAQRLAGSAGGDPVPAELRAARLSAAG